MLPEQDLWIIMEEIGKCNWFNTSSSPCVSRRGTKPYICSMQVCEGLGDAYSRLAIRVIVRAPSVSTALESREEDLNNKDSEVCNDNVIL